MGSKEYRYSMPKEKSGPREKGGKKEVRSSVERGGIKERAPPLRERHQNVEGPHQVLGVSPAGRAGRIEPKVATKNHEMNLGRTAFRKNESQPPKRGKKVSVQKKFADEGFSVRGALALGKNGRRSKLLETS